MSKPAVYDAFDKATANFTGLALILNGAVVGRIVIKFGAAATAFVQIWGAEMTRGRATGGGYDKSTAAVESAVAAMKIAPNPRDEVATAAFAKLKEAFVKGRDGDRYTTTLENAGFILANVIA